MNTTETSRPDRGDLNAAAELSPDRAAVADVDRACALLGIPTAAPAATDDAAVTAVVFQDAAEYLRVLFGERTALGGPQILKPRAIVHLNVASPTTPPRAA